jgi:hypothetical protein
VYRSSGLEGGVEEDRSISQNKKDCYLLAFESTVMSYIIGKGWTGGLKISSHITFDQQPSAGRAFS